MVVLNRWFIREMDPIALSPFDFVLEKFKNLKNHIRAWRLKVKQNQVAEMKLSNMMDEIVNGVE